jgi:hypothetical protein
MISPAFDPPLAITSRRPTADAAGVDRRARAADLPAEEVLGLQLLERARHDLAHRPDRVGEGLMAGTYDELLAIRLGHVQQVARHAAARREEQVSREQVVRLADHLCEGDRHAPGERRVPLRECAKARSTQRKDAAGR